MPRTGPFIINLPLSLDEREVIAEAARRSGLSMRQWIARIVVGAARHQIASGDVAVVDDAGTVYREPRS
jgi:uncharacterized protein (DUF1778 family)